MLWTVEQGIFLKEKHIARLLDSADYFDFAASARHIKDAIDHFVPADREPQKIRVTLNRAGKLEIQSAPVSHGERVLKAHLANRPVHSENLFLYHKTTRREVYEDARLPFPEDDDTLLYNERNELTEFTIGNVVVELDGRLITPPVECGLLPGTFRAHLLETGQVNEEIIPLEQLRVCKNVFRVNSVRKWERVRIE
jgi:para-aminobenzoate synthetase/4-amino-4-deoxychorismate lyase